jgi:hypothetical protein
MLFDTTSRLHQKRRGSPRRRAAGLITAVAVAAAIGVAPATASADTSKDPALIGLFGSSDPTFDGVYRQSLSLIALEAVDAKIPDASVEWLKRQRCGNGSYTSYRADLSTGCGPRDSNATALAVIAFKRLGYGKLARGSVNWLLEQQTTSGGWEYTKGWGPDSNSTGLVVQALVAMNIDPATVTNGGSSPLDFLTSLQLDCDDDPAGDRGALDYQDQDPLLANDFASAQATAALAGRSLPVRPRDASPARPAFTCDAASEPTPAAAAAGYLGRTIRGNDGHIPYFDDSIDYGSTANAVLSLVAAGYASRQITSAVKTLEAGSVDYTHDTADEVLTASSAALVLVAVASDGDPRSFGDVNPVRQILKSRIKAG